jgi:hypothetical protein
MPQASSAAPQPPVPLSLPLNRGVLTTRPSLAAATRNV